MKKLPVSTYILALAQALNITIAVISVTISAVVGSMLTIDKSLSTLPYGLQFASVMIFTFPAAWIMEKLGRKKVFYLGAALLFLAGAIGFLAVNINNFYILSLAHFILGSYISIANYYRFAATDSLNGKYKTSAISAVISGGVLAAFFGPLIANYLKSVPGFVDFSLCYASMSIIALLTACLIYFWRPNNKSITVKNNKGIIKDKGISSHILVAIITSSWGYFSMNLLMVQASLVMQGICTFDKSSSAIQAHVLAMFLPSFITGYFIEKIGLTKFVLSGYLFLCLACAINLAYFDYSFIYFSLIALGIGWNFMYAGGAALLSKYINIENQYRWQGMNDTSIALCATIGAFLPAPLFSWIGWKHTNAAILFSTVIITIIATLIMPNSRSKIQNEVTIL
jgi:MFS family permease